MIPKIIHQTWKTSEPPEKTFFCIKSWKYLNPDYDYILWSDEDISSFVSKHYPEYENRIENFQLGIIKADFFRLLALYHFGGIYVDLDFECLIPFQRWQRIREDKINVAYEPFAHNFIHGSYRQKLCNAFFASPPGMNAYKYLIETGNAVNDKKPLEVKRSYGPMAWSKLMKDQSRQKEINIIPRRLIYPIPDLTNSKVLSSPRSTNRTLCDIEHRNFNAYAVHYWDHSSVETPSILDSIHKNDLNLVKITREQHKQSLATDRKKTNSRKRPDAKAIAKTLLRMLQFRLDLYN